MVKYAESAGGKAVVGKLFHDINRGEKVKIRELKEVGLAEKGSLPPSVTERNGFVRVVFPRINPSLSVGRMLS